MENFIVSARKYRPQTFDNVVGQTHITSTLKNAIRSNHVAQAYLFCGPRGVGKTTCARILAKTINCTHITKGIEACDECESCESFNSGHSLNIYELDAASNNSVEDIRNLINQVSFAPQLGSHKIYIIDEVHMLSQAAFNAFLKTLEEPPKHAIFILATTEKHKIIPTILSRCQIFDFNRIKVDDIATRLSLIAQHEKIKSEPDALHIISQKADGSLRDALSIFDQMVSLTGNSILDYDYYFRITDALLEKNTSTCLLLFNEILNKGFDGHHFINGLAEHLRNLLVCKDEITMQLLEVSASVRERYRVQSKKTDPEFLLSGLNVLNKADVQYKASRNQRLLVEITLLQLCSLQAGSAGAEKKSELISIAPIAPALKGEVKQNLNKTTAEVKEEPIAYAKPPEPKAPVGPAPSKEIPAKPSNGTIPMKGKMLSIASFTNGVTPSVKEHHPEYKAADVKHQEDISLEDAWNRFAEILKKKKKINLATSLTARKPEQEDANTISFKVQNQVQADEINAIKMDFLAHLRSTLKNTELQLKLIVDEKETERKPYTGEEKFQRLSEKNPALNKLRQSFNLEIDY
jgi:DNA polymerase-3 subunit gamma/tau